MAYAVTGHGAAQPAEKLSTTMTTDPDGKPYAHSEGQSEAAKLSLTPRTDKRCDESQSLQTMAMRFAWMCDHARRLERETNCLRGTLRLVAKHADFSQCPPEVEPAVDAALLPPNNSDEGRAKRVPSGAGLGS